MSLFENDIQDLVLNYLCTFTHGEMTWNAIVYLKGNVFYNALEEQ
jgi:hypothetical protein